MNSSTRFIWIAGWLGLLAAALFARPLLPVDETRYVSVAWEMWTRNDFLVPYLNGQPYAHKPPLLFWIIHLGWAVFGVSEWWARVVSPLFGLGNLVLIGVLARKLWPNNEKLRELAPLMLLGGLLWAAYSTMTMFDMMVGFFTMTALLGVLEAHRSGGLRGWLFVGLSLGLGILTKGPVILLHVLPVALLAPLWTGQKDRWGRWYLGIIGSVLLGAAIGLAWALPAANAGGEAYANAILWSQTAGRVSHSFAHARPWWFYMVLLPVILLPWITWPTVWRGALSQRQAGLSMGGKFCWIWLLSVLSVLTLISAKQPHYLLPSLPAIFLLSASAVAAAEKTGKRLDSILPAVFLTLGALALAILLAAPSLLGISGIPKWVELLSPTGLIFAVAAAVLCAWPFNDIARRTGAIAVAAVLFLVAVQVSARPYLMEAFDLAPAARYIAGLQDQGYRFANVSKYHGQYHFLGRLKEPIDQIRAIEAGTWVRNHPRGKVIAYYYNLPDGLNPDFVQAFRGRKIAVLDASVVAANPDIVKRR